MDKKTVNDKISYKHITYINGDISVTSATITETPPTGIHFHNGWEIILITRGTYKFLSPNIMHVGSGPCIGLFRLGTYHACAFVECEKSPAHRYVINYTKELMEKIPGHMLDAQELLENDTIIIPLDDDSFEFLSLIFEKTHKLYTEQINGSNKISPQMYGYITVILNSIADMKRTQKAIVNNMRNDSVNHYVQAAVREVLYAVEHNESVSAESLSERLFVSRSKLSEDFRRVTGVSVKQMVDILRLERIKRNLRSGISNKEIVEKYDFSCESYFVQFFKKHTGISPGDYRKMHFKD